MHQMSSFLNSITFITITLFLWLFLFFFFFVFFIFFIFLFFISFFLLFLVWVFCFYSFSCWGNILLNIFTIYSKSLGNLCQVTCFLIVSKKHLPCFWGFINNSTVFIELTLRFQIFFFLWIWSKLPFLS